MNARFMTVPTSNAIEHRDSTAIAGSSMIRSSPFDRSAATARPSARAARHDTSSGHPVHSRPCSRSQSSTEFSATTCKNRPPLTNAGHERRNGRSAPTTRSCVRSDNR